MSDFTCHNCGGDGMYWHPDRKAMVLCHCPKGQSKRDYLRLSRDEKRKERRGQKRERKEPVPF